LTNVTERLTNLFIIATLVLTIVC